MDYLEFRELYHHGIKGQKWGVQNGPPYPLSKERKFFVSGSSKTQDPSSMYYRKHLPKSVTDKIDAEMKSGSRIIVGDAPGVDSMVQDYLAKKGYKKVSVYYTGDKARKNADDGSLNWTQRKVDGEGLEPNSKEWLAKKDKEMQKDADSGLAVVLENGGASATRKNVLALIEQNKDVLVYELRGLEKDRLDDFIDKLSVKEN